MTHDWQLSALDLAAYLARVGQPAAEPSLAALSDLQTAHVRTFCFDNIDVLLGQHPGRRFARGPGEVRGARAGRLLLRARHVVRRGARDARLRHRAAPGTRRRCDVPAHASGRARERRRAAGPVRPGHRPTAAAADPARRRCRGDRRRLDAPPADDERGRRRRGLVARSVGQRRVGAHAHDRPAAGAAGRRRARAPLDEHPAGESLRDHPDGDAGTASTPVVRCTRRCPSTGSSYADRAARPSTNRSTRLHSPACSKTSVPA